MQCQQICVVQSHGIHIIPIMPKLDSNEGSNKDIFKLEPAWTEQEPGTGGAEIVET